MKLLKDILYKVSIQSVVGNTNVGINKIEFDSNKINKGDLFVAIRGTKNDGNKYISHAISNGASVIICETLPENTNKELTYIIVSDSRKALALISSNYYKNPSKKLKLIGVTGTNGKTSITSLLFDLFKKLNKKVGLLSTNVILINDKKITAKQTTPDPLLINQLLNQMVDAEVEYCFMEVSSHAILQSRIYGLEFNIGVFSNLTHDHLDYHKTFESYRDVKKIFFDSLDKGSYSLTNIDDKNGSYMIQNTKSKSFSYSINSTSDFSLRILEVACLLTDNNKSSSSIPRPLSTTIISVLPPPLMWISILLEWASILFSISSFTTDTGLSTTSPAAILLTTKSGKIFILNVI